jgi:predicted DNA-binding transcriptional regulator YafY/transposase
MNEFNRKKDRTARLLKLQFLLSQYPRGITTEQIAQKCSISKRTVYRDLVALESDLGVPVWEEGNKRGITEGYFLPPVSFTLQEAMNMFICIRLMRHYSYLHKDDIISTFLKLNSIVPPPFKKLIQNTLEYIENQPQDRRRANNFSKIIKAWISRNKVKIFYQRAKEESPKEHIIDPYFVESSAVNRTSFVIGYSHLYHSIYSFNISRIIDEVSILGDTYKVPSDFNEIDYLNSAWDVHKEGELQEVRLRFTPIISRVIMHTLIHPSSEIEVQNDGSLIVTLKIRIAMDFCSWILSWGDDVEVLGPDTLRNWVIEINRSVRNLYSKKHSQTRSMSDDGGRWINTTDTSEIEITDEQWKCISEILPGKVCIGRPRVNERNIINGIIWVLKNDTNWAYTPRKYGAPSTCHAKFVSWQKNGVWDNIKQILNNGKKSQEYLVYSKKRDRQNKKLARSLSSNLLF